MIKRADRFESDFNAIYSHPWAEFCDDIYRQVRPGVIRERYTSKAGKPMTKPVYGKWEARAWEVRNG